MAVSMHAKTDSEVTSLDASTPPRSPRRPLYYVQSPSNHDVEKMSYGSSPLGSPHHFYHCSPIHHSRESSTSRFSASLKNQRNPHAWKKMNREVGHGNDEDDEDEDDDGEGRNYRRSGLNVRLYLCFVLLFVVLFTVFSLILWGASKAYKPKILVKNIVFEDFNVQSGSDQSGVPTDMLTLNSTVKILYRNPATFFGVHVTSTPFELHHYLLKVGSGQMKKFYQRRKTQRTVVTVVVAHQVPLYGGVPIRAEAKQHPENVVVPLNLTFVMRSRAYILGHLVKSKFHRRIRCPVTFRGNRLGKPYNFTSSCVYQ